MLDLLLAILALLSFLAAFAMPLFGRWDLCIWMLLLSIFSFFGLILNQPRLRELLGILFQMIRTLGDQDKIRELAGVKTASRKSVGPGKKSLGYLTPRAKTFLRSPVVAFYWLIGLPRRFLSWICQIGIALVSWRPKFNLPKRRQIEPRIKKATQVSTEAVTLTGVISFLQAQGVNTGDGSVNDLISAMLELANRVDQTTSVVNANQIPVGFDFKIRTVMQLLLKQLGVEFEEDDKIDPLLSKTVFAVEQLLPSLKSHAGLVDGLQQEVRTLQEQLSKLQEQSQDTLQIMRQQHEQQLANLSEEHSQTLLTNQQKEQELMDQLTAVSRQVVGLQVELAKVQKELTASDDQNDGLILLLDERRDEHEQMCRQLDEAKQRISSLSHKLDRLIDFSTPLSMFGHPVQIANVNVSNSSLIFCLVATKESEPETWDQWVDWLKANDAGHTGDIAFLFED